MNMDFTVISGLMPFGLEKQTLADPLTQMTNKMKLNLLTNQPEWSSKPNCWLCLCEDVTATAAVAGGNLGLLTQTNQPLQEKHYENENNTQKPAMKLCGDMYPRHDRQSNLWHSELQPILSKWVPHNKPYEIRAHHNGEPYLKDI